ncbi:adhesive plaque matrix protein-like [Anopheles marshallii]|uniref:adhesive plaque matrix protein-like n=1 Tax=Anopheles marshallii TaxID=1521116 RepID=UPI00237A9120|nr:adhesive plaque matrix protein-like [Anopheles marshallii]
MNVATPITLAVILYLVTVLEATYLERPLWVADKGRQQSLSYGNEESRLGQFQAGNEQPWIVPEPYYPQRSGPTNQEWMENQQWPLESPNAAQLVREERPPLENFVPNQGYDGWNLPDTAYEYQTKNQAQSMTNGQAQPAWMNQQQQQQQQQQVEYQKPFVSLEPSVPQAQPEPDRYEAYAQQGWNWEPKPENVQPNNYQTQFQTQENYQPYRTDSYQPKPDAEAKPETPPLNSYQSQVQAQEKYQPYRTDLDQPKPEVEVKPENTQLNNYQPQFQTQEKYQPYWTDLYQPKPDAEAKPETPQLNNYQSQFQTQEMYQPYWTDLYQPKPDAEAKPETPQLNNYQSQFQTQEKYQPYQPKPEPEILMPTNQPKPGTFMPNQPNVEPFPSNPENVQLNSSPPRPQEIQQGYNPYPPRPELYQHNPSFVEPEYQGSYYGQQFLPSFIDPEYQLQMSANKQPVQQPSKPVELPNKVRKPTNQPENQFGQAPLSNLGYYPYRSQEPWYPYQQNPTEGLQASVQQVGPEMRVGNSMSANLMPSLQGSYGPEPIVETLKPVDRTSQQQEIRKPSQPLRPEQRPNRPMEQVPEEPKYQPNRVPPTTWETQYRPQQAPVMPKPKPKPQIRPPVSEPLYNRRPETYYGANDDDDEEVVVKYEKPITRFDTRCPRDDDPAKPVHFPSATSCVKFQKCFNGIAYEMSCPPGLEFDAKSNRCDYPARARCSV